MKATLKIWDHPQALWSLAQVPQPFPEFLLQSKQSLPKEQAAKFVGKKKKKSLKLCKGIAGA